MIIKLNEIEPGTEFLYNGKKYKKTSITRDMENETLCEPCYSTHYIRSLGVYLHNSTLIDPIYEDIAFFAI